MNCSASDVFRAMLGLIMYVVVCIASLSTSFPALCNISTVLGCARLASHCLYAAVMVIGMAPVIVVWCAQLLQCTVSFGIHICIGIAGTAYTCMWLAFHCCGSAMLSCFLLARRMVLTSVATAFFVASDLYAGDAAVTTRHCERCPAEPDISDSRRPRKYNLPRSSRSPLRGPKTRPGGRGLVWKAWVVPAASPAAVTTSRGGS